MLGMEEIDKMSNELSMLYSKARTKEEYEKVVEQRNTYEAALKANGVSPNTVVLKVLPGYWAEYYLMLKFPTEFTEEDKDRFMMEKMRTLEWEASDSTVEAEVLYLQSVAWSHLMNDQEIAELCNSKFEELISAGKVSLTQILKGINSRIIREMDSKNWQSAVRTGDEIKRFSEEVIEQPENVGPAANIINNRGTSKIRGDINIKDGIKDIVTALGYYLKQIPVPMKHIEGIKNRLTEAIKKL